MHLHTPIIFMDEARRRDARTFSRAMLLRGNVVSPQAAGLVEYLVDGVLSPRQSTKGQLRPSTVQKFRLIVVPFLADLFYAASLGSWSKLETNTNALAQLPGGRNAFMVMRSGMGEEGLLEELPGYVRRFRLEDTTHVKAARTSFRPSKKLLDLANECGVDLEDLGSHLDVGRPPKPAKAQSLELRPKKSAESVRPKALAYDPSQPKPAAMQSSLNRLNTHLLLEGRIEGFTFGGLRRLFSNGDQEGFDWNLHGRFYSMPEADHYENFEGGEQTRAKRILVDGQEVAEVDISASHLTILHGLLAKPFDHRRDPYEVYDYGPHIGFSTKPKNLEGIPHDKVPRENVKAWLVRALGAMNADIGGRKYNKARRASLMRYPFLSQISALGLSPLDLQYHEAEIMRLAMEELMSEHDIGFLPVHDALIVAKPNAALGAEAIKNAFETYFKNTLGMAIAPVPILY